MMTAAQMNDALRFARIECAQQDADHALERLKVELRNEQYDTVSQLWDDLAEIFASPIVFANRAHLLIALEAYRVAQNALNAARGYDIQPYPSIFG